MADAFVYKNQKKGRQATVETTFSKGMSYSLAPLEEGYVKTLVNFDFAEDSKILVPRAGLRTTEFVFPDIYAEIEDDEDFNSSDVCIKDMKECIEDGETYVQCILGKPDSEDNTKGKIWVVTFKKKTDQNAETEFTIDGNTFEIALSDSVVYSKSQVCAFYSTDLQEIHRCRLKPDSRTGFPVGTFAYGNHYYFFAYVTEGDELVKKLYRTNFGMSPTGKPCYVFEPVEEKRLTASEAVLYGYNMLSETPYSFKNSMGGSKIVLEGILPYESTDPDAALVMTPKKNQTLNYRCYYSAPALNIYKFVWEWRTIDADTWNFIESETFAIIDEDSPSSISFTAPSENIMIRVSAYRVQGSTIDPEVEHAMAVGFDFTIDEHGTTTNIVQKNYDLGDATGMTVWKNRLVLWGVKEDPTIMFLSDMNEPGYFPYPNNITVFEEPIISVIGFMDSLMVFTTDKCYQVSLTDDGTSWNTTVIQANLHITMWDKHLIQAVRNMIYFKSGNYYYMMVPKASSTTGELTLAPISNPVTEFFNNFMVNVEQVFKDTYGVIDSETPTTYELITYYNFLDYEDVHNMYVFRWSEADTLIHFDIIYNTVGRYWRINIIEEPNLLYTFKHDATQTGVYASTSLINVIAESQESQRRTIQLYQFDPLFIKDFFIPDDVVLNKYDDEAFQGPYIVGHTLRFPAGLLAVEDEKAIVPEKIIDKSVTDGLGFLYTYYNRGEFRVEDLITGIHNVLEHYDDYFKYRNYQFLDTGYRSDATHYYKRYRELQLQINNLDAKDLNFGTEFYLDGDIRKTDFKYEVIQVIDEMSENYNIAYIEPMMFLDIPADAIDRVNMWTLEHNLNPELSLWKVRMQVSGKGTAPRLKMSSRNEVRYQLLGLNWVYRVMNMR